MTLAVTTSVQKSSKPQPRNSQTQNHQHTFDCFQEQLIKTAGALEWNFRFKLISWIWKNSPWNHWQVPFSAQHLNSLSCKTSTVPAVHLSYNGTPSTDYFQHASMKTQLSWTLISAGPSHWLCNIKSKQKAKLSPHQSSARQYFDSRWNTIFGKQWAADPKLQPANNLRDDVDHQCLHLFTGEQWSTHGPTSNPFQIFQCHQAMTLVFRRTN